MSAPSKMPSPPRERADDGRVEEAAAAAVGPVDRPQPRLRVEEAERHPDQPAVVIGAELVLVAQARRAAGGRRSWPRTPPTPREPGEPLAQAPVVHVPAAHQEVEVPSPSPPRIACRASSLSLVSSLRSRATLSSIEGDLCPLCVLDWAACSRRPRGCSSCSRSSRPSRSRPGGRSRERLGIDARTVRRYIAALQELDIPVEGQRGVGGGYRMRPGYRLPPLMLSDDEAVAVVLGLIGARGRARRASDAGRRRAGQDPARAARLPCARQVEALEQTLGFTGAAPTGCPSAAAWRCCWPTRSGAAGACAAPTARSRASDTARELSPYGLVVHAGRWYLAAYDHGRDDLRTFRVDRMTRRASRTRRRSRRPTASTPSATSASRSRACRGRGRWRCCSTSRSTRPRGDSRRRSPSWRRPTARRCCACASARSTGWPACSPARLRLHDPRRRDELRASVHALATRLAACAS